MVPHASAAVRGAAGLSSGESACVCMGGGRVAWSRPVPILDEGDVAVHPHARLSATHPCMCCRYLMRGTLPCIHTHASQQRIHACAAAT